MDTTDYITMRVLKKTHKKLRIIAANTDEKLIEALDRLATEELQRIESNKKNNGKAAQD